MKKLFKDGVLVSFRHSNDIEKINVVIGKETREILLQDLVDKRISPKWWGLTNPTMEALYGVLEEECYRTARYILTSHTLWCVRNTDNKPVELIQYK